MRIKGEIILSVIIYLFIRQEIAFMSFCITQFYVCILPNDEEQYKQACIIIANST